jgi:hypothetical protein
MHWVILFQNCVRQSRSPSRWPPQCSCVVIESSFDPSERLQDPGILWFLAIQILVNQIQLHRIYNVRDINLTKYAIWSLVVHEIIILLYFANLNNVCIHVLFPYLDIVIVKMTNSQNIIFHICMNSQYKRRKKE